MATSDFEDRRQALLLAVQSAPTATADDVVARATAFLAFLTQGSDAAAQVEALRSMLLEAQGVAVVEASPAVLLSP